MGKRGPEDPHAGAPAAGEGGGAVVDGDGAAAPPVKKFRKGTGPPPGWVPPPPLTREQRLLVAQRNMSVARWDASVGVAVVTKAKGSQWTGMGHSLLLVEGEDPVLAPAADVSRGGEGQGRRDGDGGAGVKRKEKRPPRTTCLFPEEACYMVERNYLYLAESEGEDPAAGPAVERPTAVARAYELMLRGGAGVSLEVFRAYTRMREQGWILRHDADLDVAVKASGGFLLGAYLVYKPNSRFAKSRPGAADFVLYCVGDGAALPDVFQVHADGAHRETTALLSAYRGGNVAFYRTSILVNRVNSSS